jgi:hypothetical protein
MNFEFYVCDLYKNGCIGRSGDGEIFVNEKFTLARQYKKPQCLADYEKPSEIEKEWLVDYTVKRIEAYQQQLDFIGDGLTGYLELEGTGECYPGMVLIKKASLENE